MFFLIKHIIDIEKLQSLYVQAEIYFLWIEKQHWNFRAVINTFVSDKTTSIFFMFNRYNITKPNNDKLDCFIIETNLAVFTNR